MAFLRQVSDRIRVAVVGSMAFAVGTWGLAGEPKLDLKELAALVDAGLTKDQSNLAELYRHLHANPEVSLEEVLTAKRMATELRNAGFEVTENVGGTGVVGVFKNGAGPTVLVRTDLDALPVTEKTGLPYASKQQIRTKDGSMAGVMHACGHDIHMTCWVGTARRLVEIKDRWKGTLMFIGQPAEEKGRGAKAMLDDGLYRRFPKPNFALALHSDANLPHGTIGVTEGLALANVDSVDIVFHGKGGHGSAPHTTIDPIVIAARFIVDVQTLVSRETDPTDSAVVTVGSIHAGTKHNIIPAQATLQLTVRSFKSEVREHLLKGIERIANAAAAAGRADKPTVKIESSDFTPATYNDPALTRRASEAVKHVLGPQAVTVKKPVMGGEDFGRYATEGVPAFIFWLGTIDPQRAQQARSDGTPLPSLHSDFYYPVPEPSIRTGVQAMSTAVLELLDR